MDQVQAAQEELANLETGETPQETPADVQFYELPVGDQTYKIPLNAEMPIKHNGQIIKAPLETVLNTYRQKSHVEDKFKELNQQREEFKKQYGDLDDFNAKRQKYDQIQSWSEQNPDEWARLYKLWENKDQALMQTADDPNQALMQEIQTLKSELSDYKQFKSEFQSQQEEKENQQAWEETQSEMNTLAEKFPYIDFDEKDLDGSPLSARIMQEGVKSGKQTFTDAFYSYPGIVDKLLETAAQESRNKTVQKVKQDGKQGIVARSATPFTTQGTGQDVRKLSDDERRSSALAELQGLMSE